MRVVFEGILVDAIRVRVDGIFVVRVDGILVVHVDGILVDATFCALQRLRVTGKAAGAEN